MIQVLRRRATVLTRPVITREHGSTSERRLSAIGNANEPAKTEHRGRVHRDVLRAEDLSVGRKDFGLLLQDEHHGASRSDYRERLVRRVQDQCSSHAGKASIRSHLQELGMGHSPTARPGTFRCLIRPNRSVVIPHRGGGAFARRIPGVANKGPRGVSTDRVRAPPSRHRREPPTTLSSSERRRPPGAVAAKRASKMSESYPGGSP